METKVKIVQSSGKHIDKVMAELEAKLQELPTGAAVGSITHTVGLLAGMPVHYCSVLCREPTSVAGSPDLKAILSYLRAQADIFQDFVHPYRMKSLYSEGMEPRRKQLLAAIKQADVALGVIE